MVSNERRRRLIALLEGSDTPLTGTALSEELGVTRQVIVSDVAILRAAGTRVIATPQGYLLENRNDPEVPGLNVVSRHGPGLEEIRRELYLIVDLGGVVVDVTVEHPLYGEITARLNIASRYDADRFIDKMSESKAEPLLVLTEGVHLHRITARTEESLRAIQKALLAHEFAIRA